LAGYTDIHPNPVTVEQKGINNSFSQNTPIYNTKRKRCQHCMKTTAHTKFTSKSHIKRLTREASELRARIFHLRVEILTTTSSSVQKKSSVIEELSSVLTTKNKQLLEIRLGHSL
jgi:hypothetical protein